MLHSFRGRSNTDGFSSLLSFLIGFHSEGALLFHSSSHLSLILKLFEFNDKECTSGACLDLSLFAYDYEVRIQKFLSDFYYIVLYRECPRVQLSAYPNFRDSVK